MNNPPMDQSALPIATVLAALAKMDAQAFAKWLSDRGACREVLKWQSGKTLRETWDTCERGDWLEWLLSACNYQRTAQAWAEYERMTAQAWAECERVKADTIRKIIPYPFK